MVKLPKRAPCECGAQARLEQVKSKKLELDGFVFRVRGFPQYRCRVCRTTWYALPVLRTLRIAGVAAIIHQNVFSAARLRFARKTLGLSQSELAAAVGLKGGKSLISKYESGAHVPQPVTLQAIGLFVEKWFRDRWKLVPEPPFGFDRFRYEEAAPHTLTLDLARPGFTGAEALA